MSGILVVGPHRSGTSVVASMLEALGVDFNRPPEGWPVLDSNAAGQHGEDQEFVRLLSDAMGNWRFPSPFTWRENACAQLRTLIAERETKPLWGLKTPQLCIMGGLMLGYMHEPKLVLCTRIPEAAALSLQRREPNALPFSVALHLTNQYWLGMTALGGHAQHLGIPIFSVQYENLLASAHAIARRMCRFVHGTLLPDRIKAATTLVDPALNHYSHGS